MFLRDAIRVGDNHHLQFMTETTESSSSNKRGTYVHGTFRVIHKLSHKFSYTYYHTGSLY